MFKELFTESYEVNRKKLVPSKEFSIYVDGEETYKLKVSGSGWRVTKKYSQSSNETKEWVTDKKVTFKHFNGAEIVDRYVNDGDNVTDVKVKR